MLMTKINLFGQNVYRFDRCSLYRHHFPVIRSVVMKPKLCLTKTQTEKLRKKGYDIIVNIGQPYRTLLIFLVGKSHCVEALESFKEMAFCLSRLLSRQCKVHTSQKVYQGLRLYAVYSRMWGEEMTSKMISRLRKSLLVTGKSLLISAVCMTPYDWEKNKISDEKLDSCIAEYECVEALCNATVHCEECHKRQVLDKKVLGVDYCTCRGSLNYVDRSRQFEAWEPFLESENILVWRRRHHVHTHLFSYKVFGSYDDTSLSAFLEVQLNASFRTEWDSSALELKVINSDANTDSDLLYWVVKFPHFFADRDYVFKRRYRMDEAKREVVIVNEIAEDAPTPVQNGVHRVQEYNSVMVLRAKEDFSKPGMSYMLTYFDNPGTSLPTAVTNFVASTAFPDFLRKVHKAAMSLQRRWENGEDVYVSLPPRLRKYRKWDLDVGEIHDVPPEVEEGGVGEDVVAFNESSDGETAKLSQLHVIKEALMDSRNDGCDAQLEREYKIPLKFKKVIIDLLEATEVTAPDYDEKTMLTEKIEKLVDELGLDGNKKSRLVSRLEALRNTTKTFMDNAAKKKQESIKVMNEFERRKYYYDQNSADDRALVLFKALLKNINDVLKADRDMRTGKSFTAEEPPPKSKAPPKEEQETYNQREGTEPILPNNNSSKVSNCDKLEPTLDLCVCCQCNSLNSNEQDRPSERWYHFTFLPWSWWGSKTPVVARETDDFCQACTCEHKKERRGHSSINKPVSQFSEIKSESLVTGMGSWLYYFIPSTKAVSSSNNINSHDEIEEPEKTKVLDEKDESVPWYFFPWLPRFWSA